MTIAVSSRPGSDLIWVSISIPVIPGIMKSSKTMSKCWDRRRSIASTALSTATQICPRRSSIRHNISRLTSESSTIRKCATILAGGSRTSGAGRRGACTFTGREPIAKLNSSSAAKRILSTSSIRRPVSIRLSTWIASSASWRALLDWTCSTSISALAVSESPLCRWR